MHNIKMVRMIDKVDGNIIVEKCSSECTENSNAGFLHNSQLSSYVVLYSVRSQHSMSEFDKLIELVTTVLTTLNLNDYHELYHQIRPYFIVEYGCISSKKEK